MALKITCETSETLPLSKMTEFQGELKWRSPSDYYRIMESIEKYGIAFPFFVWKKGRINYILDGHGRLEALRQAQENGVEIPPLPVVYVKAKNEEAAKNLLLRLNSRYGTITTDGMREFTEGFELDLSGIQIPELPNLAERLDALLANYQHGAPEFVLYCPECGERYDIDDDGLREAIKYED